MKSDYKAMAESSHLSGVSSAYIDSLYETYLLDPAQVPDEWRHYFQQLKTNGIAQDVSHAAIRAEFADYAKTKQFASSVATSVGQDKKQAYVMRLIEAYRHDGHHKANLNPLNKTERLPTPRLELAYHHLTSADLNTIFSTETALTHNGASLHEIQNALEETYCGSLGFEYMHITDNEQLQWLQERIEGPRAKLSLNQDEKKNLLQSLTTAEGLEKYLGSKYVGQKRFSLEGGDSLIPMLHDMIQQAGEQSVKEIVIGMAHRGRLNVLVNVLGKAPNQLFKEFEGIVQEKGMSGDVKYHMGFSSDINTKGGVVHLALAFNPSHLEIINPVVEGSVRARQRRRENLEIHDQVVPVLIHGDAAFAGQGVVMETFNFSQARGYRVGGSVHIVINNQVGFTTSNPLDARSTLYCTDVAKMVQAPIIHVNSDDPEAVLFASRLAFDFRMTFKKDVVIDLVCYRRHGHNEADEPAITQPDMYKVIRQLPTTRQQYADTLLSEKIIKSEDANTLLKDYRDALDKGEPVIKTTDQRPEDPFTVDWQPFIDKDWREVAKTAVPLKKMQALSAVLEKLPDGFTPHPVVKRVLDERKKMADGETPLNWGFAEIMAYATLLDEGYPVRLSGQDSGRGTFAHRHAVLHDCKTGKVFTPLNNISNKANHFNIIDSVLSEEAVLGFEYGYATVDPNVLVIWEAQFGDFVNGAQVVIDQFISSGWQKWGRLCGLTLFLPHGQEGQGPEHSSARLERFLQLCAQQNMQVCVPSTPAQAFHMIRRQIHRDFRKPLVVMTPKSLLRHKLATSTLNDLSEGTFQLVIPEIDSLPKKDVKRVVLCSGKVYYDLLEKRRADQLKNVAIIRIEQLYPFPEIELKKILNDYPNAKEVVWCQEEPQNQGAWYCSQHHFHASLQADQTLHYAGRDDFAAPAVGYAPLHLRQQHALIQQALTIEKRGT